MAQFYGMKVVARCLTKNSHSRFKNMQISLLTLLVLLLQTFSAMAQQPEVQSAARDAVEWRHHIHANPELSFEEYKTSNYVADLLASFGHIEVCLLYTSPDLLQLLFLRTVLSYVESNVENNNLRKILSFSPKAF